MKITSARTTVVGTPWRELVFLELETDTGLVGTSEVRMVSRTDTLMACLDELAPRHVIGTDPFDVERLAWNIQRAEYDRPGEVSQSALASFDVACWDIIGQSLGVPVWKLLGGKFRDRVPAYANGWYQAERDANAIAAITGADDLATRALLVWHHLVRRGVDVAARRLVQQDRAIQRQRCLACADDVHGDEAQNGSPSKRISFSVSTATWRACSV